MGTGRARRWAAVAVCAGAALAACTEVEIARGDRPGCDPDQRRCERRDPPRPAGAGAPARPADGGYADPSRDLGAGSPSCRHAVAARERASCRRSGSVAHRYPISAYGFDVRVGFSLTDMGDSFLGALESVAALIWMGLVYLVKAVLLLLEWAFSLDLTARAMPEARRTLADLHRGAFGEPWLLAALSIAAIWGIWRGLVQRRTTETLAGLAATVGLMVAGLVVIAQPQATVGEAARLSNDAGTAVLAASRGVDLGEPRGAMAAALADVFDATVRDPWCALQFGSVAWCYAPARPGSRVTNADVWLAYPAQSKERASLLKLLKGDELDTGDGLLDRLPAPGPVRDVAGLGGEDAELPEDVRALAAKAPERAKLQEAGGTFPRFALLAVIAVGVLGAVSLLGYLAVRLLLASALTLLLLLLAPAMLLAPAFGDSGRATFVAWARRLATAIAAKLIYALFLAVVLAAARVFTRLGIGWFGTWLVLAAFWWGVLLKRDEIVGFVSAGALKPSGGRGLSGALSQAYYAMAVTRGARHTARTALASPRRAAGELRHRRAETRAARAAAVGELARQQLDTTGAQALRADQHAARERLSQRDDAARELRAVDRRLQGYDEAVAAARARGTDPAKPTRDQQALLDHRARLRSTLGDPDVRGAEEVVRHAQRNRAEGHDDVSPRDLAAYRARRRTELDLPPNHERNLRAAGVDPDEYAQAAPARRAELIGAVQRHMSAERALLDAAERPAGSAADVRAAERLLPREEVRRRTAEERARRRQERRQQRARAGVYRPR